MTRFILPDGFASGKVAVRCGIHAMEFWHAACEELGFHIPASIDTKWQLRVYEEYGDDVTVAKAVIGHGLGWDCPKWFEDHGYTIVDLESLIIENAHPIPIESLIDLFNASDVLKR